MGCLESTFVVLTISEQLKISIKYLNSSEQPTPAPQLAISYTAKENIHNEDQVIVRYGRMPRCALTCFFIYGQLMENVWRKKVQEEMQNGLMERLQHLEMIINQQNSMLQVSLEILL